MDRCEISNCLTKHASRKSEAVPHTILHEGQWRINLEEDMLDRRKREREIRNSSSYDEELWPTSESADGVMSCRQGKFRGVCIWMCVPWYHRYCDKPVDEGATRYCV